MIQTYLSLYTMTPTPPLAAAVAAPGPLAAAGIRKKSKPPSKAALKRYKSNRRKAAAVKAAAAKYAALVKTTAAKYDELAKTTERMNGQMDNLEDQRLELQRRLTEVGREHEREIYACLDCVRLTLKGVDLTQGGVVAHVTTGFVYGHLDGIQNRGCLSIEDLHKMYTEQLANFKAAAAAAAAEAEEESTEEEDE